MTIYDLYWMTMLIISICVFFYAGMVWEGRNKKEKYYRVEIYQFPDYEIVGQAEGTLKSLSQKDDHQIWKPQFDVRIVEVKK